MYQDIYNCICQNTKKWRNAIHYVKPTAPLLFKNRFPKGGHTCRRQWLIHDTKRRKDNQLQSLNLPREYPNWVARCDIKGSDGIMLKPIFWQKVQGQKHPGRWGIVEHQIPSIKVLFKTNAKSHKHPGIKLLSSEGKTQLVNQRKQNSYRKCIYLHINTELLDGNKGHQKETHHPTHRFRRLFFDLLSMEWRWCTSAMGAIKLPPSCPSPKIMCQSIHIL